MLTFVNIILSVTDFVLIFALAFTLTRRLNGTADEKEVSHLHAKVGMTTLFLFALLGMVTGVGRAIADDAALLTAFQVVAVGLRVAVMMLLLGWIMWTAEMHFRGRWPTIDRVTDRLLHLR